MRSGPTSRGPRPQRRGPDLASWVERLTSLIDRDVFEFVPTGEVLREEVYFRVGTLDLSSSSASRLANVRVPSEHFDRLVLRYPGPGVEPSNRGRERQQVAVVEGILRASGYADWKIDSGPTDRACHNPDLCSIKVLAGIRLDPT